MVSPLDLLFPSRYEKDKDVREQRLEICHSCDQLEHGRCKSCSCVMAMKTMIADAECPMGKW